MKPNLILAAGLLVLASSCKQSADESVYTRGIGEYPGEQAAYTGPEMVPGGDAYRNLASNRLVFHSSSYDYNLTGHLLTDGIISETAPFYMALESQDGPVPKREREKLFDFNSTNISIRGAADAFLKLSFTNGTVTADRMVLNGSAILDPEKPSDYVLAFEGTQDGENWEMFREIKGNGTIGGNKGRFRSREDIRQEAEIPAGKDWKAFRVRLEDAAVTSWTFTELDFFNGGKELKIVPAYQFNSLWMSDGTADEWAYVDLGGDARFDKVVLYWNGAPAAGTVEVSKDAKNWSKVADIPLGDGRKVEVAANGNGRYVRLNFPASADGNRFALSEMEVWGKGGVVAEPAREPSVSGNRKYISGGNWKLQRASLVEGEGASISQKGYLCDNWIVATVPGTVAGSYYNAGAIPDIRYDNDQIQISESFFLSDFWYRNEFKLPEEFKGKELVLNFDGINWKADIWFNGSFVGHIDGAFTRADFDVTALAKDENAIAVKIYKNDHPGIIKEQNRERTDYNGGVLGGDNPTFHASIGWDWIPTVRGREIGIWNDVWLCALDGGVSVDDIYVKTDLPLPSLDYADLTPEVALTNHSSEVRSGTVKLMYGDALAFEQDVTIGAGQTLDVTLASKRLDSPRIWWPAGYGDQPLYDVKAEFVTDGKVSDTKCMKSGIREMSHSFEGDVLDIWVNGRRFIGNGGNWGFSEINLNYRAREYDIAVRYHADMGFTMIRNWVGMIGDEEFYEACDKYGVMVWQDFWLANPVDGPNPYDNDMFLANAEDFVRKIRIHPSIALYCGRNEGFPPTVLDNGFRALVDEYDSGMVYFSSSADGPVSGHGPYRALPVKEYFAMQSGIDRIHSERGMPDVPSYESLSRMFREEHQWPQNSVYGMHDYALEDAQSAATFNAMIAEGLGEPADMKDFAQKAQWINYNGYRAMYESRGWNRKTLQIWMSHSCWPSMVWQTYDYYFEPTAGYFGAKKGSAPIRIQWNPVSTNVEVVNNNASDQNGLTAYAAIINYDGKLIWEDSKELDSPEDTTTPIFPLSFDSPNLTDVYYIKLRLTRGDELLADNFYWEGKNGDNWQLLNTLGKAKVSIRTKASCEDGEWTIIATLKNKSSIPALMIRLNLVGSKDREQILPVIYEDNYFALLGGEEKTVKITYHAEDGRGQKPEIALEGFNL